MRELKVGDIIPYHDPTSGEIRDAEITNVREDGTVDILYQHPLDPTVRTTAESYNPAGSSLTIPDEALPPEVQSDALMSVKRTVKKER